MLTKFQMTGNLISLAILLCACSAAEANDCSGVASGIDGGALRLRGLCDEYYRGSSHKIIRFASPMPIATSGVTAPSTPISDVKLGVPSTAAVKGAPTTQPTSKATAKQACRRFFPGRGLVDEPCD
jgi:hypothetical protein